MTAPAHADLPVDQVLATVDPASELPPCGLRRLVVGSDALGAVTPVLAELLPSEGAGERPVVVLLVDPVTIRRGGADVKELVERQLGERFDVRRVVLDDGHSELHVTDAVVADAVAASAGARAIVAVGGGTISDIGKLAATGGEAPVLVTVQTAASVDGYTDDVSVVLRDGVKRTVPSRWPDAVVADTETIAEAPPAMNRAGFGEMTSMLVAPADWKLAGLLGLDPTVHDAPIRLLELVGADIDAWAEGVRTGDAEGVEALTRALALRGVATGVAGTTAVLSGVEHLVSHMLDQHHTAHHQPIGLHGAQVGAGSVVAAAAWELLDRRLASGRLVVDRGALDPDRARARVEDAFSGLGPDGRIAAECWADYARKLAAVTAAQDRILDVLARWSDEGPPVRPLARPSAAIAAQLTAAGAPATFADLDPYVDPELARWAVANCGLMRNRFSVVDLLTVLGWWQDDDVDEVLEHAARAAWVEV